MIPSHLPPKELSALLDTLRAEHTVYVPERRGEHRHWSRLADSGPPTALADPRTSEPLKAFFFSGRERVAQDFRDELPGTDRPAALVGAKACDLKGLAVLDKVFVEGEYVDPPYARRRGETIVVSSDCAYAGESCFCTALHGLPYPETGFDINLSETSLGYVAESGTERGRSLLDRLGLKPATEQMLDERESNRRKAVADVRARAAGSGVPDLDELEGLIARTYEAPVWNDEATHCVECGACNTICPTCHCFLLADRTEGEHYARLRLWDSCLIKDFARVAGGANPRPRLGMRLRNRFEKKFDFFPKTSGVYACTGCGRCVSACPGRIDIRKVLRRLTEHVPERQSLPTG